MARITVHGPVHGLFDSPESRLYNDTTEGDPAIFGTKIIGCPLFTQFTQFGR